MGNDYLRAVNMSLLVKFPFHRKPSGNDIENKSCSSSKECVKRVGEKIQRQTKEQSCIEVRVQRSGIDTLKYHT